MDNWKLVPVEPTEEMTYAGATAMHNGESASAVFDAMLAAAPQPPALGGEPVAALQFKCVGDRNPSDWSDVRGSLQLEQMQRTNELCEARDRPACYEFRELVDRAHVVRLQALAEQLAGGDIADLQETRRANAVLTAEVQTLQAEVERLKAGIEGYESGEHAAQVAETLGHQLEQVQAEVEHLTELTRKQAEAMRLIVVKRKTTVAEIRSMAKRAFNESRAELAEGAKS